MATKNVARIVRLKKSRNIGRFTWKSFSLGTRAGPAAERVRRVLGTCDSEGAGFPPARLSLVTAARPFVHNSGPALNTFFGAFAASSRGHPSSDAAIRRYGHKHSRAPETQ